MGMGGSIRYVLELHWRTGDMVWGLDAYSWVWSLGGFAFWTTLHSCCCIYVDELLNTNVI